MIRIFLSHEPASLENFFDDIAVQALREFANVQINDTGQVLTTAMLLDGARDCDTILLDRNTPADVDFFANCEGPISVHRCAVDFRNIDIDAASRSGILVTNASPGFTDAVVELSIGLMIDLARNISVYVSDYRRALPSSAHLGTQLSGSVIGIVGYGNIGARLAKIAHALDMTVLVHDPHKMITESYVKQCGLQHLLAHSRFVHCLAPATPETENLMDEKAFASMQRGAYFINVSRGNLVNEAALERAVVSGHLGGVAMDVGRADDQKPSPGLARLNNVIATPHIGGQTPAAVQSQAMETVEQVRAVSKGIMPQNAINADHAFRFKEAHRRGRPTADSRQNQK